MSQSLFSRLSLPAFESIQFQGYDPVCEKLVIIFKDYREAVKGKKLQDEKVQKAFDKLIQKTLRERFKLYELIYNTFSEDYINAFAIPPDIVKNNVLVRTYGPWISSAGDGKKILKKDIQSIVGSVNLVDATVSGFFQKVPCTVAITYGMLIKEEMSEEEIVAALLHEVGHVMTYMESLAFTFSTCFVLTDTVRRISKSDTPEEKIKIFKSVEDATGVKLNNVDILDGSDTDILAVSIFSDIYEQTKSEFGSSIYDMRSWESLSDQFSSRMGMTVHLATALDKIMRYGGDASYESNFKIWSRLIVRWVITVFTSILVPGFSIILIIELLLLCFNPFEHVYDNPGERLIRLRQEIVARMKTKNIPDEQRKSLQQDLDVINSLIKETDDKENYQEKIWLFFSSDARNQKSRRLLLQDLQSIANNNLFASANLLKTLK